MANETLVEETDQLEIGEQDMEDRWFENWTRSVANIKKLYS